MRYSGATYLSDGTVSGEEPGASTHWHVIAVDGVYSAVAGSGIDISGNTISVADESITVEKVADDLAAVINAKMGFLNSEIVNNATDTGKIYYTTNKKALIIPISSEFSQTQFRLDRDGKIYARRRSRPSTSVDFPAWDSFVDISAGVDSETIEGIVRQIVEAYIAEHGIDLTGVERTANKVTAIGSGSTDTQYPSAKAVYDLGVEILGLVNDDISNVESSLVLKESFSNKKTTITGYETSNQFYPTTKAVADALSTKAPASTAYTFDGTTTNVVYDANNPKTIYLNATAAGKAGIVITAKDNDFQYFFGRDGSIKTRYWTGGTSYSDWYDKTEKPSNKADEITNANKTSTTLYPSIKAVVDYLVANYENSSNKVIAVNSSASDTQYPSAKAVYNAIQTAIGTIETQLSQV